MRYLIVEFTRNETQKRRSEFAPWEVPILEVVHGAERVKVVGEKEHPERSYPKAAEEYHRLQTKYKSPEGTENPYVSMVFGYGPAQLANHMAEVRKIVEAGGQLVEDPENIEIIPGETTAEIEARVRVEIEADVRAEIEADIRAELLAKVGAETPAPAPTPAPVAPAKTAAAPKPAAPKKQAAKASAPVDITE